MLLGSGNNSDGNHFNTQLPFGEKKRKKKKREKREGCHQLFMTDGEDVCCHYVIIGHNRFVPILFKRPVD